MASPGAQDGQQRWSVAGKAWPYLVAAVVVTVACVGVLAFVVASPQRGRTAEPRFPVSPVPTTSTVAKPPPGMRGHQPNIVMIVTDDMRTDELPYMRNVMRLLVDRGTTFSKAISPHPLCCPARAELTTGEYAQNNGVHHNGGPYGGFPALIHPGDNIGSWLQQAGYFTGFVGKYLNEYKGNRRIPGWNIWHAAIGNVYRYHRVTYDGVGDIEGYAAHTTTRYTNMAIDAGHASGRPFYVVANYLAPHDQIGPHGSAQLPVPEAKYRHACDTIRPAVLGDPAFHVPVVGGLPSLMPLDRRPPSFNVKEARRRICSLLSVDDGVGAIVRNLRQKGELADTDIVFVSDNGYDMGEHLLHGKNLITDESLQVPIVIRGPHFPAGVRTDRPASLVDLPATYLQLSGATAGRTQDGVSLLRVLKAKKALRDTLLVQTGDDVKDSSPGFAMRGVTTGRYLYGIDPSHPDVGLLFDRKVDPYALINFFADPRYADVRAALQHRLEALMPCSGKDCNRVFGRLPEPLPCPRTTAAQHQLITPGCPAPGRVVAGAGATGSATSSQQH